MRDGFVFIFFLNFLFFWFFFLFLFCSFFFLPGIPRIQQSKDLLYLKTALQVGQTNEEAEKHFERLIHQSYENVRARLNFAVHILANPG